MVAVIEICEERTGLVGDRMHSVGDCVVTKKNRAQRWARLQVKRRKLE